MPLCDVAEELINNFEVPADAVDKFDTSKEQSHARVRDEYVTNAGELCICSPRVDLTSKVSWFMLPADDVAETQRV